MIVFQSGGRARSISELRSVCRSRVIKVICLLHSVLTGQLSCVCSLSFLPLSLSSPPLYLLESSLSSPPLLLLSSWTQTGGVCARWPECQGQGWRRRTRAAGTEKEGRGGAQREGRSPTQAREQQPCTDKHDLCAPQSH